MKYLAVRNFDRFQHYHNRSPLWIKLYNTLLDDYAFIELPEVARCHLMLIWLVASRHENRVPYDMKYLARAVHAKSRVNIDALIKAGFIAIVEESASNETTQGASTPLADVTQHSPLVRKQRTSELLASRKQGASNGASEVLAPRALAREEGEKKRAERETETTSAPHKAAKRETPTYPPEFDATWAIYPARGGGNSKAAAFRKWRARRATDVPSEVMHDGVERYAAYVRAEGKEGTAFVLQGATFFGPDEHWREAWTPALTVSRGPTSIPGVSPEILGQAVTLWARYRDAKLLNKWERKEYQRIAEQQVSAGNYPSVQAMLDELRVTRPWELADARTDGWAINELARRLAAPRQAAS